jgi:tetratricopeptide (TPR) repeat protein
MTPNWKELTRSYIKQASKQFEEEIKRYEGELAEGLQNESVRTHINRRIAIQENQYAWLISNTEGDFDRAIVRSRRSLELHPNYATYQDTLARCYYAKSDFANAVKYQKMAVKQDPFSPTMRRQLALFENAAKNATESTKDKK